MVCAVGRRKRLVQVHARPLQLRLTHIRKFLIEPGSGFSFADLRETQAALLGAADGSANNVVPGARFGAVQRASFTSATRTYARSVSENLAKSLSEVDRLSITSFAKVCYHMPRNGGGR